MRTAAIVALAGLALAGCGDGSGSTATTGKRTQAERGERPERKRPERERPAAPSCPAGVEGCAAAQGRVIALESVDPDGDGDLHVVLASRQGITFPGVSVLAIRAELRPPADPRVGDWAAGAGVVWTGSFGQRQIEVDAVVFDPPRG